jgi:pimeloyl-ACP methyl ester carboxylesterase
MPRATVGDVELYYEEHGSGDPLLLIMGLGADANGWMLQTPEFAKHYRTIVFDNRGVGRSAKPAGPYTIPQMADDAVALLDHLGIERTHVCGVSMGGMISQELALRHPKRLRSLVLGCTYAQPDSGVLQNSSASASNLGGAIDAQGNINIDLSQLDPLMFFQTLLPLTFNQSFIETDLARIMQLFSGSLEFGFDLNAILAQVQAAMAHDTAGRLNQIKVPTLVITGDNDMLIPSSNSDYLAQEIPAARLVKIPGGSHAFNLETPDVFNGAVLEFLRDVSA